MAYYGLLRRILLTICFHLSFYRKPENKAVLCVQPDYSGVPKTEIVEFITFYNAIGVTDFIIYDSGILHSIFPFLESLVGRNGIIRSITVLKWNFPVSDSKLESISVRDDCLSRTFGSAKLVGITAWNEYIMPTRNSINNMISLNKIDDFIKILFETWLCCFNYPDEKVAVTLPTFLRKTHCMKTKNEEKMFINIKPYATVDKNKVYELPVEQGVVRRYDSCNKESVSVLPVPDMYTQITSHRLLRLWKSHLNASSIFN